MSSSMEKTVFPFPRHQVRRGVVGDFPAKLRINQNTDPCDYVLIDVSSRGLGVVIKDRVQAGDKLQFEWDRQAGYSEPLMFKVLWVEQLEDFLKLEPKQYFYRVGLLLVAGCEDLLELCRQLPHVHVEI